MSLASMFRLLPRLSRSWRPLDLASTNFVRINTAQKIEEETIPDYVASRYYPVRLGEILQDRYQIVGKLGYGTTSTVWLARDLIGCQHVTLKLFINSKAMGDQLDNEISMYKRIEAGPKNHVGRSAVRSMLDSFNIDGPDGQHRCLVHPPLWESVLDFLHRNPVRRLPAPVLAFILQRTFQALDYLHSECQIIHTDIKASNIMFGIGDKSVFTEFEEAEMSNPSPRKEESDGRVIYVSRELGMPKQWGAPILCDFGSAVLGNELHVEDVQPNVYRAPEVILEVPWSYSIDIWNLGCVIWDIYQGGHLFTGNDPEHNTYRSRAHLAEIIALLGPPPSSLLSQANLSHKFFSESGQFSAEIPLPERKPLEDRVSGLEGEDKQLFLSLMLKMLQWEPHKRRPPSELAQDQWLQKHL
ncbi:hypothetical protein N0V93_007984 [Gnomoniopsis smithogilvyi]|uniref:Protein kinase domain-containing protein n=1 Tax=Gnomoniopsis smithogilvyi TaxID=1191159 RepID=A0A9W9CUB2_9PEZI|nr:hypothetical protein N0V93_007984 [Gnomoniopsis smithogilvyi]